MNFQYTQEDVAYLKSRDAALGRAIDKVGHIEWPVDPDLFAATVRNIMGQQISGKALVTVERRVTEALGGITPQTVAAAGPEKIQACGMSMKKAVAICDFADKVVSGEFDLGAVAAMSDADAIAALSTLKGIGRWTAEMLLLFTLQRSDILSFGDFGIMRGMRMVYRKRKIDKAFFERKRRRLSPRGSLACLYFWKVAGGAIPGLTDPGA